MTAAKLAKVSYAYVNGRVEDLLSPPVAQDDARAADAFCEVIRLLDAIQTTAWSGDLLVLPHPAYRVLTNLVYQTAGSLLEADFTGRWQLLAVRGPSWVELWPFGESSHATTASEVLRPHGTLPEGLPTPPCL